jgi:ligand-binding sensor domain-containing protein
LAQSADGYLWLGSTDGLYRFDGVVFEHYQPQSGGPFPARYVHSLLALPNGDLWIGFRSGGMSLLRNGKVTNYTTRDGAPDGGVWGFAQDRDGSIWAATSSGLARLEDKRWKEVGKDWNFPGKAARAIFLDHQGTLWVSTEDTLVFLPSGAKKFQPTGIRVGEVTRIAQAASGKLWMAETTRSIRPIPLSDKRHPADEIEIQVGSREILFDNDGALWITSLGDGLRRSPAPELLKGRIKEFSTAVESFTARDGLSDDVALTIFQDREGNIWVGTNNGLDRFRKTNLVPVVGIPFKPGYAVLSAGDAGDAWVARLNLMFRLHGGHADPNPNYHLLRSQASYSAVSAYHDPTGAIWWLWEDGIYRYDAGNYTRISLPRSFPKLYRASAMVATEDGSGALWLSAEREGLFYRKKAGWQRLESASEFAKLSPVAALTDWMGRAWFGYGEGTIILVKDETIQKVFLPGVSLVGAVRAINGRGRHTWVGGEGGLAFFDGNRFRRIIPTDAEAFGLVMGVEEPPDGSLWLAESRGVVEIPATEVRRALDDPSYRVKYRVFDSFDGLPGLFVGTASTSREVQGTDGRLWFAASNGIVWIDPANISTNPLPPPVLIRFVNANGRQHDAVTNLILAPRTTNLEISYTALSLSVPEKVRFRYRLEGVDKDWQDAGTRRAAFYTMLGPGRYHFQVIAFNNDGVWNEEGARLDFDIASAWYQTKWFYTLCAVAFLAFLWLFTNCVFINSGGSSISSSKSVSANARASRGNYTTPCCKVFTASCFNFRRLATCCSEGRNP